MLKEKSKKITKKKRRTHTILSISLSFSCPTLTLFTVYYFLFVEKGNEVRVLILRLISLSHSKNYILSLSISRKVCAVHAIREPLVWVVGLGTWEPSL
jgi:hypothetical protein